MIVPAALVKVPPSIEYDPPALTLMGAAVLIPVMVTVLEVATVLNATSVCGMKLKASGVVSAGTVVTLKPPFTPPTVRVTVVVIAGFAEDV